jgi:ATPase subunit of ABC transporter with duplicated ATPase domains
VFEYDNFRVIDTVMMGHRELWEVMKEKDAVYAKTDFTDADGLRAADLE